MDKRKGTSLWRGLTIFAGGVGGVTIIWLISWVLITRQLGNPTDPGPFGDMFGAVNALFSGLAFAGVIVAILLQRQELIAQREELGAQREEAARSTKAQQGLGRAAAIEAQLQAHIVLLEPLHMRFVRIVQVQQGQAPQNDDEQRVARIWQVRHLLAELKELANRPDD